MSEETFKKLVSELREVREKLPEDKGTIVIEMSQGGVRQIRVEEDLK